jgi:hypothetical protein
VVPDADPPADAPELNPRDAIPELPRKILLAVFLTK